jgi:hypothetical protein
MSLLKFALIFCAGSIFCGCTKETSQPKCLPISAKYSFDGASSEFDYQYDSQDRLIKVISSDKSSLDLKYDSKNYLSSAQYNGNLNSSYLSSYTYNDKGQMIKEERTLSGTFAINYEYSLTGQMTKGTQSDGAYFTFDYASPQDTNPKSEKFFDSHDNLITITEYEYDNFKLPFDDHQLMRFTILNSPLRANNLTKVTIRSANGLILSDESDAIQYNQSGYPIQIIRTINTNNTISTLTLVLTYNCK